MNPHYQYFLATGAAPLQGKGDDIISPPPPPPPREEIRPSKMPPAPPSPPIGGSNIEEDPNQQTVDTEVNIYTQPVAPIEDVLQDIDSPTGGGGGIGGGIGGGENTGQAPPPTKTWLPLILVAAGVFVLIRKTKK